MKLIERYATSCALKIGKPFIYKKYFPVPFDKYILIHSGGGMPAKIYDYFNEVISILSPILLKYGYQIFQIGGKDDVGLHNVVDLRGLTDFHQTAYLLDRASLLIGNDSCNLHIASSLNTPVIGVYGSTRPSNHGPSFGDTSKQILIEGYGDGEKPSFSPQENPKMVNKIKPEEIASSALKLLNIPHDLNIETLHIGSRYNQFILEIVMDNIVDPNFYKGNVLTARMDYLFNEDILAKNLSLRPYAIVTDKPLNINLINTFKKNIVVIIYKIGKNYSIEFLKNIINSGIQYTLVSDLPKQEVDRFKLEFLDYNLINEQPILTKENVENHEKVTKYTLYKTNKFLLANNKIYLNKKNWENNKPIKSFLENVDSFDAEDVGLIQELEYLYIFNK